MRLMAGAWLAAPRLGKRSETSAQVTAPSPQPPDHNPSLALLLGLGEHQVLA